MRSPTAVADRELAGALPANAPTARRFLIWGISFGESYRALAALWLQSIVQIGGWRHDIVLLGDQHVLSLKHPQLRTYDIESEIERQYALPREQWTVWTRQNWKPQIQFYVDLTQYDYVLYLDVDVLVNTDRLERLIVAKCERGVICVQQDEKTVSANKTYTGRETLTAAEKVKWADRAICSGMIGFPINELGLRFIKHWHDAMQGHGFRHVDQAVLTALLLRHYDGQWDYMGDTAIAKGVARYDETLLHFAAEQRFMRDYYGKSLRLREENVFRQRCYRAKRELLWRPFNTCIRRIGSFLWQFDAMQRVGRMLWEYRLARRIGLLLWY